MNLNLRAFSQLVEDMGSALQSSASSLIDVSVGSVIRAIFEANASVVLWLQWLILQVLQTTRASTSIGPDLDSWMLDFGQTRLPAVPSTGVVTFSRFAANLAATIPIGTLVKTTDGSLSFSVASNQALSIWKPIPPGYILPAGVASADLPVTCSIGGSVGNVLAGTINVIAASLPGIDQVVNAYALTDAADAESDQAFRGRFQSYLSSRSRATLSAVRNAIGNVRQGLEVAIEENAASDGTSLIGSFLVVVDDGTGYPSSDLLLEVTAAVDAVRPIGTRFAVVPPQVIVVNTVLTAVFAAAADASLNTASIEKHIAIYLNTLSVGGRASITRVAQSAYLAGPSVENIVNVQLNGSSSDIVVAKGGVIKSGLISVLANDG